MVSHRLCAICSVWLPYLYSFTCRVLALQHLANCQMVWDASVVEVKSLVGGDTERFCFSSRVIDGLETLDELEKLPVNEKTYRPLNDVHIKDITIHANPFALWPLTVVTRSLEAGQTDCWMAVFDAPSDRVTGAGLYLGALSAGLWELWCWWIATGEPCVPQARVSRVYDDFYWHDFDF